MFEKAFKNIEGVLWKEAGCTTELDYEIGVEEWDQEKLTPLLRLRCQDSLFNAITGLGKADVIGKIFPGFPKYPYQQVPAI